MNKIFLIQFFLPLFWAIGFYVAPLNVKKSRIYSLIGAIFYLIYTIRLIFLTNDFTKIKNFCDINFSDLHGFTYSMGLDGLSAVFVILNAILLFIVVLISWNFLTAKYRLYYFLIFVTIWTINGLLLTTNLLSFFIFWEIILIPILLLIGVFGGYGRKRACYKLIAFNITGSTLMLSAMIYLSFLAYGQFESYNLTPEIIRNMGLEFNGILTIQSLLFCAFCTAFFLRISIFPFHSWMIDVHAEAPTAASIIISGILFQMGIYGLLRFVIPVYIEAVEAYSFFIMFLGAFGIIYGLSIAFGQKNIKKMIAYISVSQTGIVVVGLFALNEVAMSGAIFQSISNGLLVAGLFAATHFLYIKNNQSFEIDSFSQLAKRMPVFTTMFFVILLGIGSTPFTSGFVGGFLVVFGVYEVNKVLAMICCVGIVLIALCFFLLFQKMVYVKDTSLTANVMKDDISLFETLPFIMIIILVVTYGVFPQKLMTCLRGPLMILFD